ncbi:MAG: hypothetical protein QF733_08325 [Phycisphaerales bacterium]|jgi:hypothetical protein|nr:hypothetical protein [Phycisphaerales bacterium]
MGVTKLLVLALTMWMAPPVEPPAAWPSLLVGLQNSFAEGDWVPGRAWFISGWALGAPKQTTVDAFIAKTDEQLAELLAKYLLRHPALTPDTTAVVVLDIERPERLSRLAHLLDQERPEESKRRFRAVVEGFKRRVAVVRAALPNAVICLYDFGSPAPKGKDSESFRNQVGAQRAAVSQGLLAGVDAVCPVLYMRFGAGERGYASIARATEQSIEACRSLLTGVTPQPRIIPLLSFAIFNGNSVDHGTPADVGGTAQRLELLDRLGIRTAILWSGDSTISGSSTQISSWYAELAALRPNP